MSKSKKYLSIAAVTLLSSLIIGSCANQSNHLLALEITSPQSKSEVTTDVITVSGIVSSPQAMVTVNNRNIGLGEDGDFSTTVDLDYGANTIIVSAALVGKDPITKTVIVTRTLALEITSPEDNAEVTESPILIIGTVSDLRATVTVNDREVMVAEDGAFSTYVELDYIKNAITVSATVDGEQPVTKTVTISRVLVLELTSPGYSVEVTNGQATITGIVSPPTATVTANGQEAQVAKDGSFSITIELDYGENIILVSATDPVTKTVTIVRLLTLELNSPQDKEEVSESQIIVSGIVSDSLVTVMVNDIEVAVAQDGTFSTTVELDYGVNNIIISAIAEGQELITKNVTITRVLALEITSPEDNDEVTESTILIKGTVSDPLATVTVNDREVEVAEKGTFSTTVSLDQGENTIVVSAALDDQEKVTKTMTVMYFSPE